MLREFRCVGLSAWYMRWQKIDISCSEFFQITRNKLIIKKGLSTLVQYRYVTAIGELCCKVSFLVNTFSTNLLVGKFELTLLILIMNLTLKKWSRHACFHKVTRIFLYKIFLISLREILRGWEIWLAVSTANDNFSLKGVGESTFWAVHNHVIANETSLHHLFCAL